jgi:hypothetical protein
MNCWRPTQRRCDGRSLGLPIAFRLAARLSACRAAENYDTPDERRSARLEQVASLLPEPFAGALGRVVLFNDPPIRTSPNSTLTAAASSKAASRSTIRLLRQGEACFLSP